MPFSFWEKKSSDQEYYSSWKTYRLILLNMVKVLDSFSQSREGLKVMNCSVEMHIFSLFLLFIYPFMFLDVYMAAWLAK